VRIGLDLFPLVPGTGRGGGFHRYATGLVHALHALGTDDRFFLFTNPLNASMFPDDERMTRVVVALPPQRAVWPFRLLWQHALLPAFASRHRLDLIHFPMDVASYRIAIPYVVTINDVIADVYYPAHHPASVSRLKSGYLFTSKRRSARRARRVICPSAATAADVNRHYGVRRDTIAVIPDGVDSGIFAPNGRLPPSDPPYVLSVVSLSPHKNVETTIEAFARARDRHRLPHELRLIGMPGTDPSPVSRAIQRAIDRGVPIRYLGFVDDEALASAYAGASVFVFLSRIEGFGLPPLEAMASGTPVVASNASSLPEVCGDAAMLVSPDDADGAADAIARALTDPDTAARLAAAGRARAAQFSWAETARRTRAVYSAELDQSDAGLRDRDEGPAGQDAR
jgi:glycosyltransferase involved in cell wall biosynthesis